MFFVFARIIATITGKIARPKFCSDVDIPNANPAISLLVTIAIEGHITDANNEYVIPKTIKGKIGGITKNKIKMIY